MIQRIWNQVVRAYAMFWSSETAVMVSISVVVGLGAGVGAVLFRGLIAFFSQLAFGSGASALKFLGTYNVVFIPAIGGLGVGPMVYFTQSLGTSLLCPVGVDGRLRGGGFQISRLRRRRPV